MYIYDIAKNDKVLTLKREISQTDCNQNVYDNS